MDKQKEIWNDNVKIDGKNFRRKNYIFNFMIKTDGASCSILLIKTRDNKPININSYQQRKVNNEIKKRDKYIEESEITNEIKNKKIVACDPNLSDLIYCVSEKEETFRYTQNQRRLETRKKKYSKIIQEFSIKTKINGKTIKEIETELTRYNSKTSNYNKFVEYCKKKNEVNMNLFEHYKQFIFRKLKLNIYILTHKKVKVK
jgi:hypothetical protein